MNKLLILVLLISAAGTIVASNPPKCAAQGGVWTSKYGCLVPINPYIPINPYN